MTARFVSFAQNLEDVVLWRALKHVEAGFYIDVGAYSPSVDSVTLAFYERGWHGVNIDANQDGYEAFLTARPRDVNLQVAVADRIGEATLYVIGDTGLSTLDGSEAQERIREGFTVDRRTVQVVTLASIWDAHIADDQDVHFLKVDVEGLEQAVLAGNDWDRHRPWVLAVEATRPQTTESTHDAWEGILTSAGYVFVYADGLNRFYVADEHQALSPAFAYPPNVFDSFVRSSEVRAFERLAVAEARAARAERDLAAIRASRSWQITRPLRSAGSAIRSTRSTSHDRPD